MKTVKYLQSWTVEDNICCLETNAVVIKVLFLTDDIIRIRAGFDGDFVEASYSLMMTGWDDRLDSLFAGERKRVECKALNIKETDSHLTLIGVKLQVVVQKNPFQISVYDEDNTCIYADAAGLTYMEDSNHRRLHYSEIDDDDCFYGFGEKSGVINKAKTSMKMSGKDAMGYDPEMTDGLYKHIPFYIKLSRKTRKATGFFYHNTYECEFNMGREKSNYWHYYSKYMTDGGDIDLFLIHGPKISRIVEQYTDLTGKSALLPVHALGYLGSSMYYPELEADCDDEILNFINTNHREGIPIDGFQLSSGYCVQENNKRCTFTWNNKRFKEPEKFFKAMEDKGVTVTPNVKPGFLLEHPLFEELKERGMFVKDSEGTGIGTGSWWGGEGAFVDFTNEEARNGWKEYLKKQVLEKGTASIWNDNCEYDSLTDKDCICHYEGEQGSVGQLKPIMANLMCKITDEAIRETFPNTRPYIVCRAGYSGIQKYAQTWAGDNLTCYESLKYNIATILGMSLSGVANQGGDIGGFYGPAPEGELLVRWIQNGIFQPRFSIHSVNTDNTVTEPWMYPEYTEHIKAAIKLRYKLIPYFYSLMAEAHQFGTPIMRPMFYEFQDDLNCYEEGVDFMLGQGLLIANVVDKGALSRKVYLPKDCQFYDYYTRTRYEGGSELEFPVDISSIPMFIRAGSIIPYAVNTLQNLHQDKVEDLGLLIEPSKDTVFNLYEDDGVSYDFEKGIYKKTKISVQSGQRVIINFASEGSFVPAYKTVFIDVISRDKGPYYVEIQGRAITNYLYQPDFEAAMEGWHYNHSTKSVEIKYPYDEAITEVLISFEQFDMIGM